MIVNDGTVLRCGRRIGPSLSPSHSAENRWSYPVSASRPAGSTPMQRDMASFEVTGTVKAGASTHDTL